MRRWGQRKDASPHNPVPRNLEKVGRGKRAPNSSSVMHSSTERRSPASGLLSAKGLLRFLIPRLSHNSFWGNTQSRAESNRDFPAHGAEDTAGMT